MIYGIYLPPACTPFRCTAVQRLGYEACAQQLSDEWCLVDGTILKPKLGLRPKPFGGVLRPLAGRRLHQER
jgi:hypothetical protein